MDDSIYRDFYWAADQARVWWAIALPYLQSKLAMRLYVLGIALPIAGLCSFIAYKTKAKLKEIKLSTFLHTYPGPKIKRLVSITNRIADIKKKNFKAWLKLSLDFAVLFIFGSLIPTIGFFYFCANYEWFDASHSAFVNLSGDGTHTPVTPLLIGSFMVDQFSNGGLLDFADVFSLNASHVTNNRDNLFFSTIVFAYRSTIGTFFYFLFGAIYNARKTFKQAMKLTDEDITGMYKRAAEAAA